MAHDGLGIIEEWALEKCKIILGFKIINNSTWLLLVYVHSVRKGLQLLGIHQSKGLSSFYNAKNVQVSNPCIFSY